MPCMSTYAYHTVFHQHKEGGDGGGEKGCNRRVHACKVSKKLHECERDHPHPSHKRRFLGACMQHACLPRTREGEREGSGRVKAFTWGRACVTQACTCAWGQAAVKLEAKAGRQRGRGREKGIRGGGIRGISVGKLLEDVGGVAHSTTTDRARLQPLGTPNALIGLQARRNNEQSNLWSLASRSK